MPGSFRVARILGIDLRVHPTWILIFLLFTYQQSLAFDASYPSWPAAKTLIIAAITALLFFASVVVHELAHSLVARGFRMPVSSITLFLLGGVASLNKEPPSARAEFLMAAAGPATSLAIGGAGYALASLLGFPPRESALQVAKAMAGTLGEINVIVAIFNLIPGFPLDGGRVLRSSIWGVTRDRRVATSIAARGGQLVAILFVVAGGYFLVNGDSGGLWWGLIAYFLFGAATQTLEQERIVRNLGSSRVGQIMTAPVTAVGGATSVAALIREHFLARNVRAVPVADDAGRFGGLVTVADLRRVAEEQWPLTRIDAVMTRGDDVPTVRADDRLVTAIERFGDELPLLPVVDDAGRLVGVLYREAVEGYIRMRETLGGAER